ncbi:hypothetical protein ACQPYH_01465 [Kribbella sp. CA-245084]|uniref:hypothetical protein n=1 Tax=Kribbella sp. CA-245084 TaxID=3239940 RepID=UPI003D90019E
MNGMTIVWIVVAVAALVIVVALIAGAVSKTSKHRAEARPPSADATERSEQHERRPRTQNLWPEDWDDGNPLHDPRRSKHTKH